MVISRELLKACVLGLVLTVGGGALLSKAAVAESEINVNCGVAVDRALASAKDLAKLDRLLQRNGLLVENIKDREAYKGTYVAKRDAESSALKKDRYQEKIDGIDKQIAKYQSGIEKQCADYVRIATKAAAIVPMPVPEDLPPPSGDFSDLYAKWQSNPHFHFGNRMSDPTEISANASKQGFAFDGLPYHSIDTAEKATVFHLKKGELALPHGSQIRLKYPLLSPENTKMATFVWEAKYDKRAYNGGKAFQITSLPEKIHIEHNPLYGSSLTDPSEKTWLMLPATRTYSPVLVGGLQDSDKIATGTKTSPNPQPALQAKGRKYQYIYARDHVTGTDPIAFLVKPEQWYRYIYTIDWRSEPHRIFLWMEAEDTPRTLLVADEFDSSKGFPLQFSPEKTATQVFMFEFNNSTTLNSSDLDIKVRNFFIVKDVLGGSL